MNKDYKRIKVTGEVTIQFTEYITIPNAALEEVICSREAKVDMIDLDNALKEVINYHWIGAEVVE